MKAHTTLQRAALLGLLCALLLVGLSGCYRATATTTMPPSGQPVELNHKHFIFGLVSPGDPVNLKQYCPNGVARIEAVQTFGDGCLGSITLGIYTPSTSVITCASGSAYLLGVDEDGKIVQAIDVTDHKPTEEGM